MPRQTRTLECPECHELFEASAWNALTCSPKCRKKRNRRPSKESPSEVATITPPSDDPTDYDGFTLLRQVRAELVELQAESTSEGVMALALARRVESPLETGSAAATMTRELTRLLDIVRRKAGAANDGLAQIEARAEHKLRLIK